MELTGKVAVVAGAASGIGLGLAHKLAAAGCRLSLPNIDADALGCNSPHPCQSPSYASGSGAPPTNRVGESSRDRADDGEDDYVGRCKRCEARLHTCREREPGDHD